jgi:WD40 repeat protein
LVRLWDFKNRRLLKVFNELLKAFKEDGGSYGVFVDFSRDDHWLCAAGGQNVALFNVADPQHASEVFASKAHIGYCWSALFAPDNRSLVTAGNDGLIKFWNLDTFAVALTLEHSRGPGVRLGFSADGKLLVSKDAAGLVKLWPALSFAQISPVKGKSNL